MCRNRKEGRRRTRGDEGGPFGDDRFTAQQQGGIPSLPTRIPLNYGSKAPGPSPPAGMARRCRPAAAARGTARRRDRHLRPLTATWRHARLHLTCMVGHHGRQSRGGAHVSRVSMQHARRVLVWDAAGWCGARARACPQPYWNGRHGFGTVPAQVRMNHRSGPAIILRQISNDKAKHSKGGLFTSQVQCTTQLTTHRRRKTVCARSGGRLAAFRRWHRMRCFCWGGRCPWLNRSSGPPPAGADAASAPAAPTDTCRAGCRGRLAVETSTFTRVGVNYVIRCAFDRQAARRGVAWRGTSV